MTTTFDLLSRGYFPKELPPPFVTDGFANAVSTKAPPISFNDTKLRTRPCLHNFARVGSLRRRLGIPNPIAHYNLSKVIADNWGTLDQKIRLSQLSRSYPLPNHAGRALPSVKEDLIALRAHQRATARFLLKADITRFYHSIYTHSIAWAVHSKPTAKTNHGLGLLGNLLDFWIRNGQDGQTLGIPIGPDTSLVIAELILSAVDRALVQKVPKLRGFRFIDDYELTFSTRSNAEFALGYLQEVMSEFELALSAEKTSLIELPSTIEPEWTRDLRDYAMRPVGKGQATDIVGFFDRAYLLARLNPGKNVLAYAIGRLRSVVIAPTNWQLYQDLLFQAVLAEPGTIVPALRELQEYQQVGFSVDSVALTDVVNIQVAYQAPIGHGSEVAWAMWAAIEFGVTLTKQAAESVSNMNDCVVALLVLDAQARGLVPVGLDTTGWQNAMTADELYGENWLLAYEANVKGWLPTASDHVAQDPNFGWLKSLNVEFYDASAVGLVISTKNVMSVTY